MTDDPTNGAIPPDGGEFVDRRSGVDRRGSGDRRHGGRRHRRRKVSNDRRKGRDRRRKDRRSGIERRIFNDPRYKKPVQKKAAPSVYGAEDAARVKHVVTHVGYRAQCPVCGGGFTLGPVDRRGTDTVRQVTCADCGRGTVVTNCVLARVMVLSGIPAMRTMLRGILTGAGHEVVEPPHTGAARDIFRENPADVVVLDGFALTEMDGPEFIRQLRREPSQPGIVVLAPRPSYQRADPSATAVQLGATHVLRIPFTREDLLRAVKEARK